MLIKQTQPVFQPIIQPQLIPQMIPIPQPYPVSYPAHPPPPAHVTYYSSPQNHSQFPAPVTHNPTVTGSIQVSLDKNDSHNTELIA
jgi:hypothetical protein